MRMAQQMKLSPRMIQSMEILQLPSLALEERIEQEMSENPLLEMAEIEPDEDHPGVQEQDRDPGQATAGEAAMVVSEGEGEAANNRDDFERLDATTDEYAADWRDNISESAEYQPRIRSDSGERDAKMDAMANTAARGASLTEQLLDQWRFIEVDPELHRAGEHLISFIDDDGYLRTDMQTVRNQAPRALSEEQLLEALEVIQQRLEPPGIGARDLAECLALQLDALIDGDDPDEDPQLLDAARLLVTDHLKDVEMNRLPRIAQQTDLPMARINQALARLRRLDPHPGRQLAPDTAQIIIPDVIVEYDNVRDIYVAGLARGRTPSLRISPQYRQLSKDREQPKDTRQYLSQQMHNARWLIDAIDQRNSTLLRVVNVVIDAQREFLDHGPEHLKPLPMIQVADQLGIHVGTVSRAVSEKYLQTPRGIFPLRMFFSGGTESQAGEEMSWAAVQAKLKQIIDSEDPHKPWSDEQLVAQLKAQGLEIARRTVAKYRQQMNIPPARRRKQF
jgi:RNA polymerase sigma-54 factor